MAVILHVPEALRVKLGEDGTRELVNLLDQTAKSLRENIGETAAERIERRLTEAKSEIKTEIAEIKTEITEKISAAESRLVWKMLAFWATQTTIIIGVIGYATKLILMAIGK